MLTTTLAKRIGVPHKSIVRLVSNIKDSMMFSQSEIEAVEYVTSQNKRHTAYIISDSVVVYLLTSRRMFKSSANRLNECANILEEIGANAAIVLGQESRGELEFRGMLSRLLGGDVEIISQHYVAGRFIDFYLPELHMAIEYDEPYHGSKTQEVADKARKKEIDDYYSSLEDVGTPIWVRVTSGNEIEGIREILGAILYHGLESELNYLGYSHD